MGNQDKYLRSRQELAQGLNGMKSRKATATSDKVRKRELKANAEEMAERKRLAATYCSGDRVLLPDGRQGMVVHANKRLGTLFVKPDGIRSSEPFAATKITRLAP